MRAWLTVCWLFGLPLLASGKQTCEKWVRPEARIPMGITQQMMISAPLPDKSEFKSPKTTTVVLLDVLLDRNGRVACLEAVNPSSLASAVEGAARRWLYHSYFVDGKPVAIATRIIFIFDAQGVRSANCDRTSPRRETKVCWQEYPRESAFIRGKGLDK